VASLDIKPAGADTAKPINLRKRIDLVEAIAGPLAGLRIIDCGCGAGDYVAGLAARGADAIGFEYQAEKVLGPESKAQSDALSIADIERIPFGDETFDVAIVNEVLEHVPDDLAGLREVHRILRPGGRLIVFSPNRLYPFETHGVHLRGSDRRLSHAVPLIPYLPLPIGRLFFRYWARNYWPWQLRGLIRNAGFEVSGSGFVWQTFENISGQQPGWIRAIRPQLRALFDACEGIPGIMSLGASQVIYARRRESLRA
jgi:SAM-dependent methyltransferase